MKEEILILLPDIRFFSFNKRLFQKTFCLFHERFSISSSGNKGKTFWNLEGRNGFLTRCTLGRRQNKDEEKGRSGFCQKREFSVLEADFLEQTKKKNNFALFSRTIFDASVDISFSFQGFLQDLQGISCVQKISQVLNATWPFCKIENGESGQLMQQHGFVKPLFS